MAVDNGVTKTRTTMKTNKEKKTSIDIKDASSADTSIVFSATGEESIVLRLESDNSEMHVSLDKDSIENVTQFLLDQLKLMKKYGWAAPSFKPTGRAIAVIDTKSESIVFCVDSHSNPNGYGHESDDMTYDTLREALRGKVELKSEYVVVCFNLLDKGFSRTTVLESIRASVCYQKSYILSGDPFDAVPMKLDDIEGIAGLDISTISRCTNNVDIFSEAGRFCMERGGRGKYSSIYDEGVKKTDGSVAPRKEVLNLIKEAFADENPIRPYSDEYVSEVLLRKGYIVKRRTVTKYRDMLGIPSFFERRVK